MKTEKHFTLKDLFVLQVKASEKDEGNNLIRSVNKAASEREMMMRRRRRRRSPWQSTYAKVLEQQRELMHWSLFMGILIGRRRQNGFFFKNSHTHEDV
jgi:hypothetical protein